MSGRSSSVSALIGLGGNIGDPQATMAAALRKIDALPSVKLTAVSSIYKTPPWGRLDQPDFLNAVAALRTTMAPMALLNACLEAERSLKRVRNERWGPRTIDIDILWFDDRQVDEPGLQIPHPRMLQRAFVMTPLAEIAPDLRLEGRSVMDIASGLDAAGIEKVSGNGDWWRA